MKRHYNLMHLQRTSQSLPEFAASAMQFISNQHTTQKAS